LIHSAVRQLSHSVYYTRSLHDALPISSNSRVVAAVEAGICLENFISGSSALMGSWKIMAIFLPRSFDISRSDNPSSSRPWKVIEPEVRKARGKSPMMDKAVSDLTEPDSPIRPTRPPRG